jgi:hypothetical protein
MWVVLRRTVLPWLFMLSEVQEVLGNVSAALNEKYLNFAAEVSIENDPNHVCVKRTRVLLPVNCYGFFFLVQPLSQVQFVDNFSTKAEICGHVAESRVPQPQLQAQILCAVQGQGCHAWLAVG